MCPVGWLDEAVARLGIVLNKVYLGNPYRGLEEFKYEHRAIYFGRQAEISELSQLLWDRERAGCPGILILAASGVGKSSLVQAGLIPALEQYKRIRRTRRLFWRVWKPSDIHGNDEAAIVSSVRDNWLQSNPLIDRDAHPSLAEADTLSDLVDAFAAVMPSNRRYLWMVNQMEELFTGIPTGAIQSFSEFLRRLQNLGVWVVATLRNDFFDRYQEQLALIETFGSHDGEYKKLGRLDSAALEDIIRKPAKMADLVFETDASGLSLAARIQQDMAEAIDALPLLEFALSRLYEMGKKDKKLTFEAYRQIGALKGAIGHSAESIYQVLESGSSEESALRRILWALSKTGNAYRESTVVSQGASLAEFQEDGPERKLIDSFIKERLLVCDGNNIRIAHEALLTHWPRAKKMIDSFLPSMQLRDRLIERAAEWEAKACDPSLLLPSGLPLEEGRGLLEHMGAILEHNTTLINYVKASTQAEQDRKDAELARLHEEQTRELAREKEKTAREQMHKKRFKTLALGLLVLSIITGIAGFLAWQGNNEVARALSYSDYKEGLRLVLRQQYLEALTYLSRSLRKTENNNSINLISSLISSRKLTAPSVVIRHPDIVSSAKFSSDSRWILTASNNGTVQVWDSVTGRAVSKQMLHSDSIRSAEFSPDGLQVLTASLDGTARLWESETGKALLVMKHNNGIHSAKFSPDGQFIVTASIDKSVRVWSAVTGKPLFPPMLHRGIVVYAEFSPDGRLIVTASGNDGAQIWNAKTGKFLYRPDKGDVHMAKFSPDSKRIITISGAALSIKDETGISIPGATNVALWEVEGGHVFSLPLQDQWIHFAEFSPDGSKVVTASEQWTAQVWDAATGRPTSEPMRHQESVKSARFSPDGRSIVTTSTDQTARIWDAETGYFLSSPIQHQAGVSFAEFNPDGSRLSSISEDGQVRVWDIAVGKSFLSRLPRNNYFLPPAVFNSDLSSVVSAINEFTCEVWQVKTDQPVRELIYHQARINSIEFSPDGRKIVTASDDKSTGIWNADTGVAILKPIQLDAKVLSAKFSPDNHRILTTADNNTVQVWDADTGQAISKPMHHPARIQSAEFSSNSHWILTHAADKTVRKWDAASGQLVSEPALYKERVIDAKFSPKGRWIAMALDPNTLRIWDSESSEAVSEPIRLQAKIDSIDFSPEDNRILTVSDNTVLVWNVKSGHPFFSRPIQHQNKISSAKFSFDGRSLVTASQDTSARVWDAESGQPISPPLFHSDEVNSAEYSPNGHQVLTASDDGGARLWDVATGQMISEPMRHSGPVMSTKFSSDGKRFITTLLDGTVTVWENPALSSTGSDFSDIIEQISPIYFDDSIGGMKIVTMKTRYELKNLLAADKKLNSDARRLLEWWLTDPIERTVTPNSKQTVKERVQQLIEEDTVSSLNEALDYWPGHSMALAKLAAATLRESKPEALESAAPRIRHWANLALHYAPGDANVRLIAQQALHDINIIQQAHFKWTKSSLLGK
ncbi:MAG: nSTAND1 domain-containing NTPase [Methylobacter sp.]